MNADGQCTGLKATTTISSTNTTVTHPSSNLDPQQPDPQAYSTNTMRAEEQVIAMAAAASVEDVFAHARPQAITEERSSRNVEDVNAQHAAALRDYPDPRLMLGPLYEGDELFES